MCLLLYGVLLGRWNVLVVDNRQRVVVVGRLVILQQMMVLDGGGQLRIEGGESCESWCGGYVLCWMDGWMYSVVQYIVRYKDIRIVYKVQDNVNGCRYRQVRLGQVISMVLEEQIGLD